MSARSPSTIGTLVAVLLGPLGWASHLLVVYGAHASICVASGRLPLVARDHLPLIVWSATALAFLVAIGHAAFPQVAHRLLRAGGSETSFTTGAARVLSALAAVAIAFSALAITIVPMCAVAR